MTLKRKKHLQFSLIIRYTRLNVTIRNGTAGQYIQLAKGSVLQEVQICTVTAAHPTQLHKSSHKSFRNIWLEAQLLLLSQGCDITGLGIKD